VSPDGSTIAFLEINPTTQDAAPWAQGTSQLPGGYVFTVPVSGGTPKQFSPTPAIYGPRWIGAGGWLVWTRLDGVTSSSPVGIGGAQIATSVVAQPAGGGTTNVYAKGDGVSSFVSTSGSGACSTAPGAGTARGLAGALLGLLAFAALLRKRSRSS
jgi:hypothetical protein